MNEIENLVNCVDLQNATVGLRKDGIIHIYFKSNCEISGILKHRILISINKMTEQNKKYPIILEAGDFISVSRKEWKNILNMQELELANSFTVYVQNLGQRLIADHFRKNKIHQKPFQVVKCFNEGIQKSLVNMN